MATTTRETVPEVIAPPEPPGPIKWARDNLFSPWYNSILTLISVIFLYFAITAVLRWAFLVADWTPVIQSPLLYAIGQYPREEMWRVGAGLTLLLFLLGLSWGQWGGLLRGISLGAAAIFVIAALLPVSHPQLTQGMRLYLGLSALLIVLGYFIGRLEAVRSFYIIIAWLLSPAISIGLIQGFENELILIQLGTFLLFLLLGVVGAKLSRPTAILTLAAGAVIMLLSIFTAAAGQLALITAAYFFAAGAFLLIGYLLGGLELVSWRYVLFGWLISLPVLVNFLPNVDFSGFIPDVSTTAWGGLLVTLILAAGGIILSFPIGVLLALGRRSKLPVVSAFSTIFIEAIRGVPLVTILFMFSIILALFLPEEARLDRLLRALMAVIFFSAAYTAENVRGGLQSVPSGQIEAAKALGMSGFQTMSFIVLPQAIRAVLPSIVGQFISLFKDTTLVVIVGINDFLGIGRSIINSSPEFVQRQLEVYVFIAAVYMIFSYLMSMASRRLEVRLGAGER